MSGRIYLKRAYLPDGSGTFGRLSIEGATFCTLELPWRGNEQMVSCIPEGVYEMAMRESEVVRRSSKGRYNEGWEIVDVVGREFIMFHVGNWTKDTEGCVLIGERFSWHNVNGPAVVNSQTTFRIFMELLSSRENWDIEVSANTVGYP